MRLDAPPRSSIRVECRVVGHRAVLTVAGELDVGSVGALTAVVDHAVEDGAAEMWIDLTPTTFMDSSGLHVMFDTQQRLAVLNRRFAIICSDGCIRRLFEAAGLSDRLQLFSDRAAAHRAG